MTEYHVEYRIEVDAESREEAARKVAYLLANGGAGRGSYQVTAPNDATWDVDLSLIECNTCKQPASDDVELGYGEDEDLCHDCHMKAEGYVECPNCNGWRRAYEMNHWPELKEPVSMCDSCEHNARRSGWEPGR